jgi:ribonuclease HII
VYRSEYVAGVDEVGRGPLAGSVYAAAVVLNPFVSIDGLRDSKQLSQAKRNELVPVIKEEAIAWCIASANVAEIDSINILQASLLAMRRAVDGLGVSVDFALIDGNKLPDLDCDAEWLVKGDSKSDAIKAASIIAKVERDNEMARLDELYPGYGLAKHKGYPTAEHLAALRVHGPSPVHRMSFAPCREARN